MYVSGNPPTKAAIKRDLKAGKTFNVFQPNNMFGTVVPDNGTVTLEGPHFPKPHRWYGTGTMKDGKLVAIK